jgi:hypothetical protein
MMALTRRGSSSTVGAAETAAAPAGEYPDDMSQDAPPSPRFRVQFCIDSAASTGANSKRGNGELPVNNARRYRLNAAECLSVAERCQPSYRRLAFTIAAYWLSLARQQKTVDELLANCSTLPSASPDVHPM